MPIPTQCQQCGQPMTLPEAARGREILCLACRSVFVFSGEAVQPAAEPSAVTPASAAPVMSSAATSAEAPWYASEPATVEAATEAAVATAPAEVVPSTPALAAESPWYVSEQPEPERPVEVPVASAPQEVAPAFEAPWYASEQPVAEASPVAPKPKPVKEKKEQGVAKVMAVVEEAVDVELVEEKPKPPARKPAPVALKVEKPPAKAEVKPTPRPESSESGSNKLLLIVGLTAFSVLAVLIVGGGAGAWLYLRQPGDDTVQKRDGDDKKDELLAQKEKPPPKKIEPKELKPDDPEPEEKPPIDEGPIPELVPVDAAHLAIKPPTLVGPQVTRDLPGVVENICVGADGRYLFLHIPKKRQIAMFDVNEAAIVHSFPTVSSKVRFAASRDRLVIAFPGGRGFQRWNVHTKQREAATVVPGKDPIGNVLVGSASDGPIMIAGKSRDGRSSLAFIDLSTFKPLEVTTMVKPGGRTLGEHQARVSADGTVFAAWGDSVPTGLQTFVLADNQLKGYYEHTSVGHIVPGPDGKFVFTGGGVFTSDIKPVGANVRNGNGKFTVPAVHGDLYLRVNLTAADVGIGEPRFPGAGPSVDFVRAGQDATIATLENLQLGVIDRSDNIPLDRRIYYIPQANLIVTLPAGNTKLVLRHFDIENPK